MAAVVVIGPIFEVDLLPEQYEFSPGTGRQDGSSPGLSNVTQQGRREVVDADLRDYFTSIRTMP